MDQQSGCPTMLAPFMPLDENGVSAGMLGREEAAVAAVDRIARARAAFVTFDSQPRLLEFARRLRQRIPGDERFGDPLSTSGVAPAQVLARGVSVLQPERASVAKELGLAGLQLWQSLS